MSTGSLLQVYCKIKGVGETDSPVTLMVVPCNQAAPVTENDRSGEAASTMCGDGMELDRADWAPSPCPNSRYLGVCEVRTRRQGGGGS